MLAYAFQALRQNHYEKIASEEFEDVYDLFAEILSRGVSQQLKQGLYREYITYNQNLSILRGKLNIYKTIQNKIRKDRKLSCEFDELSENNIYNQILKTTILNLIKSKLVRSERKKNLKNVIAFFGNVDVVPLSSILWSRLKYQRNNKSYDMLMNICYFVLENIIQSDNQGNYKMLNFSDEHMEKLYERFILEYYKKHHKYLSEVKAMQVQWDLDDNNDVEMIKFLPKMQTDITLRLKEKYLIIDAKYYGKSLQTNYDKSTIHSNNMYQIYTYVKNQDRDNTGNVAGLLLYAKTSDNVIPKELSYNINGNKISAQTLDLNQDFKDIAMALDNIAFSYFKT